MKVKDLLESIVKTRLYTVKVEPYDRPYDDGDDLIHVKSSRSKLRRHDISAPHEEDGEYGPEYKASVTNNKTGETTHHSVYQSGIHGKGDPLISIRSTGLSHSEQRNMRIRELYKNHSDVLAKMLQK